MPDYFTHRDHTGNSQLVKSRRPIYADDRAVCESARGVRSLVHCEASFRKLCLSLQRLVMFLTSSNTNSTLYK